MTMKMKSLLGLAVVLTASFTLQAQTCKDNITPSTPTSRFSDLGDGSVKDTQTNLIWMRCSLGQSWDGTSCTGSAATYTWANALAEAQAYSFAGSSAWQLPNLKQLTSIVEEACYDPAINASIFPATASNAYWTASPYAGNSSYAWDVAFFNGSDDYYGKGYYRYVRLVRPDSN